MKIMIISHTFANMPFAQRWIDFAEKYKDIDVYLESPEVYDYGAGKDLTYGRTFTLKGTALEKDNCHIRLIDMKLFRFFGIGWKSKKLRQDIKEIKPDIIYHIGTHFQLSLVECIKAKKKYVKNAKVVCFSMRGAQHSLNNLVINNAGVKKVLKKAVLKNILDYVKKNVDAVICHYPEAMKLFRSEGYSCPIYMSTQVGVRTDIFHFMKEGRKNVRNDLGISNNFVFGTLSRFNPSKGIQTVIDALPKNPFCKLVIIGSGTEDEKELLLKYIDESGKKDQIIVTGYIDWDKLPAYLSALDCFVHMPKTTPTWVETFSLALCQAMAVGLPVIGNTSGSVPYQLGRNDMIVEEGDINSLYKKMNYMMNDLSRSAKIGQEMRDWCVKCFSTDALNAGIYEIFKDIYRNTYDINKIDMTIFTPQY